MRQFTIYDHPKDFPDHFVVRGITILPGGFELDKHVTGLADTLEEARAMVPNTCDFRVPRHPADDPVIVETWI